MKLHAFYVFRKKNNKSIAAQRQAYGIADKMIRAEG